MAKVDWSDIEALHPQAKRAAQLQLLSDRPPQAPKEKIQKEKPEDRFAYQCRVRKLPPFVREFRFAKSIGRQWQFDFAFGFPHDWRIAVELEGFTMRKVAGVWHMGGRHASVQGFKEDCVKYNTAALMGWTVLRFTHTHVAKGYAIDTLTRALMRCGWVPPA